MTLEELLEGVMITFQQMLRENPYEENLRQSEIAERLAVKKSLRKALRNCIYGDRMAKLYVKDFIRDILLKRFQLDKDTINEIIPFDRPMELNSEEKFDIVLYQYESSYKNRALEQLIEEYQLDQPRKDQRGQQYFEISAKDIDMVYSRVNPGPLPFMDKVNILAQQIYERYKGNGVIDEIRDMKIDGISAGVSGIPEDFDLDVSVDPRTLPAAFDSIWLFFHGKSIHLSFLSFHSYKELIRVCRNIYRYNNPGQLSEAKGYTVNEMKDGARIAVARPPFCESWVLFVRKFDTVLQENIFNLLTDTNAELPIRLMQWLIKGCRVTAVTGQQGSGKTTLLMSLIGFINPAYNLRIQELSFELHLRKIYPNRNIVTFRETSHVSGSESLDFAKKTDGTVTILGEVANDEVSVWLIKAAQVASLFTLFTHHAKTTENLVRSMRNSLLLEGGFQNERAAEEQVVDAINFDIHMKKNHMGHRYIERITEIVPDGEKIFCARDIVVWENGAYRFRHPISEQSMQQMRSYLEREEILEFEHFLREQVSYV